jgi:transposase InsO family protein
VLHLLVEPRRLSYSAAGTPTENGGQESFFGRFKEGWRDEIFELQTLEEVERFIKRKLRYYNYTRLHTSIGYTTPFAYTMSVLGLLKK